MESEKQRDTAEISFVFEGDYAVSASAVAKALDGLTSITTAVASYEKTGVEYRLSVLAFKPGSFIISLLAAAETAKNVLTPDNIAYAANLSGAIGGCFALKCFLKGKLPKAHTEEKDVITVQNAEGATASFPKSANVIFVDQRVDQSISYIIESAEQSSGVSGVRIETPSETVRITRDQFAECAVPLDIDNYETSTIVSTRANEILYVRQPDLLGDSKWGFRGDKNFVADVTDTAFLDKVRSGEYILYSGMYIVADITVTTKVSRGGFPDERSCKYAVNMVHSVSSRDSGQIRISDEF